MTFEQRSKPKILIQHPDKGTQYTNNELRQLQNHYGIVRRMSRRGNCLNNAVMKSLFSTLTIEYLYKHSFQSIS